MSERTKHETIGAALCAAIADVEFVVETGRNQHHNYSYANDVDLLRAVRPAMVRHGLALIPHEMTATRDGQITRVNASYLLVHADSDQTLRLAVVGEGSGGRGSEDKGAYKALTGCYKYLLRHTFAIPTGDDAEAGKWDKAANAPETKPEAKARRAKHDPEWEDGGRSRFMAELSKRGLKYEVLKKWLAALTPPRPKPSEKDAEWRKGLMESLTPEKVSAIQNWAYTGEG